MLALDSISQIHIPELWSLGLRGDRVRVGVIGTGIDLTHPDFTGCRINAASLVGNGIEDVADNAPHETGVVWLIIRIAPHVEIILIKDRNGPIGAISTIITACQQLLAWKVDLVNLSMSGAPSDDVDPLSREVNYLTHQGITVVAAAGNFGPGARTVGSPGVAEGAITVGKVDEHDTLARKSSRGPTLDRRMKPECVAPGRNIIAAVPSSLRSRYGVYSCTSFAAPHVTGAIALLKQAFPLATPLQMKQALMASCDPVNIPFSLHDQSCAIGTGRINASRAYGELEKLVG